MKESRIKNYHHDRNFCELDGSPCIHCKKCDHISTQSSNRFTKLLIVLVIVCIIIFVLNPIIMMGIEKGAQNNAEVSDNLITSEDEVQNYNEQMLNNEKAYQEYTRIEVASISDNYNLMG